MRIFLRLLCFLCAAQVFSTLDGICLRKELLPGVLVLSPGSKLVLTCSGHVMVNGVNITRSRSVANRSVSPSVAPTTTGNNLNSKYTVTNIVNEVSDSNLKVSTVTGENRSHKYTDTASTTSPTTHKVYPTNLSRPDTGGEETNGESDYDEDEEEGGEENRVTRGIKLSPQWKFNGKIVGKGKRDWGMIRFERRGATLTLSSVRLEDSGNYTCLYGGRERFSITIIIEDPPEKPTLSCFKRSPSSKIRCQTALQKTVTKPSSCYFIMNKSPSQPFHQLKCTYSSRLSQYWFALDNDEDELRTYHVAFLCLSNIAGNVTSSPLYFTPLNILKPDPPSGVEVQQLVGHERYIRVNWKMPISWKSQDRYYKLTFEIKYKPVTSSNEQIRKINQYSVTITDLLPGAEYLIQVRTKEQYDGEWSDWSTPVRGTTWKAPEPTDVYTTMFTTTEEGSGSTPEDTESAPEPKPLSYHILWISGSFLLFSLILAIYIFGHMDKFMPKLHHLSIITQWSDSSQPPAPRPTNPEEQTLVACSAPRYKEPPLGEFKDVEAEDKQEQTVTEMTKSMHFNNSSYFLLQPN